MTKRQRVLLLFIPLLLTMSWLAPVTRVYWDQLDQVVFYALNGSLAQGSMAWQYGWAMANHRAFDLIPGLFLIGLYGHLYCNSSIFTSAHHALATGVYMAAVTILTVQFAHLFIDIKRQSPSLILEPVWRTSALLAQSKDHSGNSFPGDHATVLLLCSGFFYILGGRRYGHIAVIASLFFILPRLVSGAHWITDIVIGAAGVSCLSLALVGANRCHTISVNKLTWMAGRIWKRITKT